MEKPKEIIVNIKNVHKDEVKELLDVVDEQIVNGHLNYQVFLKSKVVFFDIKDLETALSLMHHLEENSWDWQEKYEAPNIPRIPTWIGIEFANEKVCVGINLENGTDLSVLYSDEISTEWIYPAGARISVRYGEDETVFDKDNNLT